MLTHLLFIPKGTNLSTLLPPDLVVMFADIAGSTQLYERLGDHLAHKCISNALVRIANCAQHNNGRLIETIGDEAMLAFSKVDDAIRASTQIQQTFLCLPAYRSHFISVRVGFHSGPVEYAGTHPFGDTVNVAARVVSLCDAGRIVTTKSTLLEMGRDIPPSAAVRPYQTARVKGKSTPLQLQEILWDTENSTSLGKRGQDTEVIKKSPLLEILHENVRIHFNQESCPVTIGRGDECELVIKSDLASRAHARIEMRYGEVYLRDHSTNGTYVDGLHASLHLNRSVRVHRREVILNGEGLIGIGEPVESARQAWLLRYAVQRK